MASIETEVLCEKCNKPLDCRASASRGAVIITVYACEFCQQEIEQKSYDNGFDDGKDEASE